MANYPSKKKIKQMRGRLIALRGILMEIEKETGLSPSILRESNVFYQNTHVNYGKVVEWLKEYDKGETK